MTFMHCTIHGTIHLTLPHSKFLVSIQLYPLVPFCLFDFHLGIVLHIIIFLPYTQYSANLACEEFSGVLPCFPAFCVKFIQTLSVYECMPNTTLQFVIHRNISFTQYVADILTMGRGWASVCLTTL